MHHALEAEIASYIGGVAAYFIQLFAFIVDRVTLQLEKSSHEYTRARYTHVVLSKQAHSLVDRFIMYVAR